MRVFQACIFIWSDYHRCSDNSGGWLFWPVPAPQPLPYAKAVIKKYLSPISFVDVPETLYKDAMLSVYDLNRAELARDIFV